MVLKGGHWVMLGVTALLFALVARFVNLKPKVDENFFFASSDPQLKQSQKIDQKFPSPSELILTISSKDISSSHYLEHIQKLTGEIQGIRGISSVKSLTAGPKDFNDAVASPFWSRLLLPPDHKASNILVFVSAKDQGKIIRRLEHLIGQFDQSNFRIHMAGSSYVVEMIRRNLNHDFWYFSLTAVVLFGLTMALMFRSARVFVGMLVTCINAVLLTLLLQSFFGQRIGVLTVNLGTIIFVVTLSHLVYMTFNWQTLADRKRVGASALAKAACRMTLPASFWSMICASLGFGSLLLVEAKPLRELGFGGVLGSIVAFVCAYLMYPSFLDRIVPKKNELLEQEPPRGFWTHRFIPLSVGVIILTGVLSFGLSKLNTDPSLLDYFKRDRDLRDSLQYVDRSGGANPLTLVVSDVNGQPLNTDEAYHRLWALQGALEKYKSVGTVVSLPTLLAEGDRTPFSFLISYEHMMRIMEEPKHARVADSFVSRDRKQAVFLLRMVETKRSEERVNVIDDLRGIAKKNGFKISLVGGVYYLQGRLATLVKSSLVTGLFWLNGLFAIIALVIARSFRTAIAMIVSLTIVPLCMLGGIGWFGVPMDIISAPATNVCIGIAIDSMIHLVFGVRRALKDGKKGWATWIAARREQWRGIVYSDVIIAAGFAIFILSDFPPTQRFGVVVLAGCTVDILANLFVLPLLAGAELKRKKS